MTAAWLMFVLALVLTLGTALFVAAEFSLVALDKPTVARAVAEGDRRAKPVLSSLSSLSTLLSACQVGITLTTLILGYIAEPSIGTLLTPLLEGLGLGPTGIKTASTTLAMLIATAISMILGEMVPKTLAVSAPLGTAKVVATPMRIFTMLLRPLILLLQGSANWVLRRMGIEPAEELSTARSPVELASLVRTSAQAGTMEARTAHLVQRSLGFGGQTAEDVMTPRSQATSIGRNATAEELVALARSTGHSRFPVTGEDWDDIAGVVHVKKAIAVPHARRASVPVAALMASPEIVPETMGLDPLLLQLRGGLQLAIVVDEYGGTAGVVTLEDLVEEIVGEVADEHDRSQTTGRALADGSWVVPGLWRPDEVRDRLGASVPDEGAYETMGGWIMAALGRVPSVGESAAVDGWQFTVVDMDGRRVDRLRAIRIPVPEVGPADAPHGGETR